MNPAEWYQTRYWKDRAQRLFNYYAKRRDYRVQLDPSCPTASVSLGTKHCRIGTTYPSAAKEHAVRFNTSNPAALRDRWVEALAAHEAAHVRFTTASKPDGLLGQLTNVLEDERIERLQSRNRPKTAALFDFLGDQRLGEARQTDEQFNDALKGTLHWRNAHDHPDSWTSNQPELWEEIKPLVELAWTVSDTESVIEIAREIMDLIGLEPRAAAIEGLIELDEGQNSQHPEEISVADEPQAPQPQTEPTPQDDDEDDFECTLRLAVPEQAENSTTSSQKMAMAARARDADTNHEAPQHPGELKQSQTIVSLLEGNARAIAALLQPPEARRTTKSDRSRGRFNYDRYSSQSERPYLNNIVPGKRQPISLTLALDVSASMGGTRLEHSVNSALLISRACEISATPFEIATFGKDHTVISGDIEQQREALTEITLEKYTILKPTLAWCLEQRRMGRRQIVIVITDGELSPDDYDGCAKLVRKHSQTRIIPVLINECPSADTKNGYTNSFGRILEITRPATLEGQLASWLRSVAQR